MGVDELGSMLPGSDDVLDGLIERAILSGLVRREPAGTVGFTHDLFREVTYGELPEPRRREAHRRAAEALAEASYRPTLVADHLLRAATADPDPALVTALHEAVAATREYAPEVTAELLDDVAAISGSDVPEPLLLDHVQALFLRGRGESAETLVRERITARRPWRRSNRPPPSPACPALPCASWRRPGPGCWSWPGSPRPALSWTR